MPEKKPKRVAGYVRVSRVGGREGSSYISEDVQEETIRRIVAANGWELEEPIVSDPDVSGAKKVAQRKLGQLVDRVEAGELAGIVVWRVSRFSRDLLDAVTQAARIKDAGGFLVGSDLDTRQPMGRAMLGFLAGWAEEEREQRAAGFLAAQERIVGRGVHFSPVVPVGYLPRLRVPDGKGGTRLDPDQPLRVDPAIAPFVREAFLMRGAKRSMSVIGRYLAEKGVCPGGSSKPVWSEATTKNMLRNPVYKGQAHHGLFVHDAAHEAIVSEAEWDAAQVKRTLTPSRNGTGGGVLNGVLRCAVCRKTLQHHGHDGGRCYRCKLGGHLSVNADRVEEWLEERLWEVLGDVEAESAGDDAGMAAAAETFATAQAELAWYATNVAPVADRDAFLAGLQKRQLDVDDAARALAAVSSAARLPDVASLREAWPDLSREERREVYAEAFPVVWVRGGTMTTPIGERVLPVLAGEAVPELPMRGRRVGGDTTPVEYEPITW